MKLRQTGEMWICALNAKCLHSKPFPADTWAQLESRAGPSCYHIWPMSCHPSPAPLPALHHFREEQGPVSMSSIVFWLFIQIFMFLISSFYSLRLFLGLSCRTPIGLRGLRLQVTSCLRNIGAATTVAPPQAVPSCHCGDTGRTGKGNPYFLCFQAL